MFFLRDTKSPRNLEDLNIVKYVKIILDKKNKKFKDNAHCVYEKCVYLYVYADFAYDS